MKKVSLKTYLVETIDDAPGQEFTGKKKLDILVTQWSKHLNCVYTKVLYLCAEDKLAFPRPEPSLKSKTNTNE